MLRSGGMAHRMRRIVRWGWVVLAVAAAAATVGQTGSAQPKGAARTESAEGFAGTWRYRGSPGEGRALIGRAIDRATDDMFFVTRGTARKRLRDKNRFSRDLEIAFPPGRIRVGFDMITYETSADGRAVRVPTPDGETASLSQRHEDGRLVQIFRTDEGRRTNVFTLTQGGDTLRYDVRVDSGQLPRPVRYRLMYRRVD